MRQYIFAAQDAKFHMADTKTGLSIYLLRPQHVADAEALFHRGAPLTNGLDGLFVDFPTTSEEPRWFRAVKDHLPSSASFNVQGQSAAGMLLINRAGRRFVVTFGRAWQYLELIWLEPDFGRRVALETIPPDEIIEVGSEQVFAKFHNSRERAPHATSLREFGVEAERDLVGAIEGVPSENDFGKTIRGATSLRVNIVLATLHTVLDKAAALFSKDTYRDRYPTIDNLMPVNPDEPVIQDLEQLLDADIQSGRARQHIVMVAPSFRRGDATSADAFSFGRRTKDQATSPYLQYASWEYHLGSQTPSLALAKGTKVHMFDDAGDAFETRTAYECFGYERSHKGTPYVLSSGVWYAADAKFTTMIDRMLRGVAPCPVGLPAWNQVHHEDEYNRLCCTATGCLHFDRKIISFGGARSKFEFCDFMDPTRRILFFAKITGRSYDSSHLVEQVKRTVELLFSSDPRFRRKLETTMKKHYPNAPRKWLQQRPRPGDWQLCLVSLGRTLDQLPLFAKCSIARLCRSVDQAGHSLLFAAV